MAEAEHSTVTRLPIPVIWDFVKNMDNWAPMLTGYQSHEKKGEHDSIWTLKGDVGVLARTVQFEVHVTEWNGPEHVAFSMKGLNEEMDGGGSFTLSPYEAEEDAQNPAPSPEKGFFARLWEAIVRFFFRRSHGSAQRGAHADAGPGAGMAKLVFNLQIEPGGPMAPMLNAMIQPAMLATAEDLSHKIIAHLEQRQRT